jgi:hypothetical protein
MPGTLRWASVVLALTAPTCAALRLLSAWFPLLDITSLRIVVQRQAWSEIRVLLVVAIAQVALCVLVRIGLKSVRVALTITSVLIGLVASLTVVFLLVEYNDFTQRVAVLGAHVRFTGWGIATVTIEALAVVSTVMGLFLLYRPSSNAYFAHVRELRSAARPSKFPA